MWCGDCLYIKSISAGELEFDEVGCVQCACAPFLPTTPPPLDPRTNECKPTPASGGKLGFQSAGLAPLQRKSGATSAYTQQSSSFTPVSISAAPVKVRCHSREIPVRLQCMEFSAGSVRKHQAEGRLIGRYVHQLVGLFVGCLVCLLVSRLVGRQICG